MGKPGKPGKPFKTSRFSATNRDSPVPCRHGAINHPQAALAMWPWRSPIGMAITNNGVFTWHSPIFLSPCLLITDLRNILLYKYMHNTFTYAYIHIRSIYIYLQNPPVLNFGLLAESTKFQPLAIKKTAVFVSKKNVLGRSSLNHVQVVLIQIVIPMLPLLAPAISTKSATEEHA